MRFYEGQIIGGFSGKWLLLPLIDGQPVYPSSIDWRYCIDVKIMTFLGAEFCLVLNPLGGIGHNPIDRINHSDKPNCRVEGLMVVADMTIQPWDELFIDYSKLDCTEVIFDSAEQAPAFQPQQPQCNQCQAEQKSAGLSGIRELVQWLFCDCLSPEIWQQVKARLSTFLEPLRPLVGRFF
jgi:hypothetical protein